MTLSTIAQLSAPNKIKKIQKIKFIALKIYMCYILKPKVAGAIL